MIAIDAPHNSPINQDTTSGYNPRIIVNTNYPILGDDAYFLSWKGKKLVITGRNTAPDA
jgi:hypothetical protein